MFPWSVWFTAEILFGFLVPRVAELPMKMLYLCWLKTSSQNVVDYLCTVKNWGHLKAHLCSISTSSSALKTVSYAPYCWIPIYLILCGSSVGCRLIHHVLGSFVKHYFHDFLKSLMESISLSSSYLEVVCLKTYVSVSLVVIWNYFISAVAV